LKVVFIDGKKSPITWTIERLASEPWIKGNVQELFGDNERIAD